MSKKSLLVVSAMSLFAATALSAEKAIILESFEENIDSVALGDWGGTDRTTLNHYTKAGADDINVTHGTKSLKVDLAAEGWVHDFKVTLSEEASSNVLWAAQSGEVARWIIRYDVIFPGNNNWMNNQAFLGSVNDQLNTPDGNNGGKATMSWALDLATGLPTEGQVVLRYANNFDSKEDPFVTPVSVYLDNIRLVDTYAPGAKPVTTILQSFEDASNPTGGAADFMAWGGTPRTTYASYTKAGADDIKVSHGNKSLAVTCSEGDPWKADFTLPFTNTLLAAILKLDQPEDQRPTLEQLARYTFRYDLIFTDRDENNRPGWATTQTFALNGSWLPFALNRRDAAAGQVQTLSFTLDQMPGWTLDGGDGSGAPLMVFVHQGDFGDWPGGPATYYYDNFRIIDTGAAAAENPKITGISMSQGKIVITWTGAGTLESAATAGGGAQWNPMPGVASGTPIDPPAGGVSFYRVKQ